MNVFEQVFDANKIYESLFFNVVGVTEYPDVYQLNDNNLELYNAWVSICENKYNLVQEDNESDSVYLTKLNKLYKNKAVYFPEFSKVVTITYATVAFENGGLKRYLNKIIRNSEEEILFSFKELLDDISSEGIQSTPNFFPTLCGFNVVNDDIPLFIKRLIKYKDNKTDEDFLIPYILKGYLISKPWDSNIIDVANLYKFNGVNAASLDLIVSTFNLKKTVDLMDRATLSQFYWDNIEKDSEDTLNKIALQSANQTNIVIQMINEMRTI